MALRAVPEHPKFAHLKTILRIPKAYALGCLEGVWHFTSRFTPQGNIGKYSDAAIEAWLEWPGEPGVLVSALCESQWLERNDTHRLIVHDWYEHADDTVNTDLARKCLRFATGELPKSGRLNQYERDRFKQWAATSQPELSQVPASLTEVSATAPKPVPVPVPVPDPVPVPVPEAAPDFEQQAKTSATKANERTQEFHEHPMEETGIPTFEDVRKKLCEYGISGGSRDWGLARTSWKNQDYEQRR